MHLCDRSYFTGDAAYVAADYRTYFPILLLAGILAVMLIIYIILFRQLKPYHSIQQTSHHDDANGDVVELVVTDHDVSEKEITSETASL